MIVVNGICEGKNCATCQDALKRKHGNLCIKVTKGENLIDYHDFTVREGYGGTVDYIDGGLVYKGNYFVEAPKSLEVGKTYAMSFKVYDHKKGNDYWRLQHTDGTYSQWKENGGGLTIEKPTSKVLIYVSDTDVVRATISSIHLRELTSTV